MPTPKLAVEVSLDGAGSQLDDGSTIDDSDGASLGLVPPKAPG